MTCADCPLHKQSAVNCMSGEGPAPTDVMLIGEAPGANEEREGRPFVGETGKLLTNDLLPLLGLNRSQVRITNACRCRPPGNRTPESAELLQCRKYLIQEIQQVQPKLVILLGASALEATLGLKGIQKHQGQLLQTPEFPGVTFIATYHPASLWRTWENIQPIKSYMVKGMQYLRGNLKIPPAGDYRVCHDADDAADLCKFLKDGPRFAFDTETTGLNFAEDGVLCFSFSNAPGTGWVIPIYQQYQRSHWVPEVRKEVLGYIKELLESDTPKVAQNGIFDLLFCKAIGIEVKNYDFDTMLASHLIDENLPHDLDTLINLYTGIPNYSNELGKSWDAAKKRYKQSQTKKFEDKNLQALYQNNGLNYGLIPNEELWKYSAADADATLQVAEVLEPMLKEQGLTDLFQNLVMPMTRVITRLRWNGILVDQQEMFRLQDLAEKSVEGFQNGIESHLTLVLDEPVTDFNTRSSKQMKEMLIDRLGWPVIKKTPKDAPSFDEEAMIAYRDHHKRHSAGMILEMRGEQKKISTFLAGSDRKSGIVKHIWEDGKVHPDYKMHVARTGRLSATDPAIHNISREGGLRSCYIPPPGWWWVELDYSQLELRVLACESKDLQLNQWFAEGLDVHRMVAAGILGKPPEDVTDEERVKRGKNINFGIIYGQTPWGLAEALGCSSDDAKTFIDLYFQRLPGVKKYFDRVHRGIYHDGKLTNAFGRIRHLYGVQLYDPSRHATMSESMRKEVASKRAHIERQAVNCPIQSAGSDILNLACIRIDPKLESFQSVYVHHHHDALHLNCPPDELLEVVKIVKGEMEAPVPEYDGYSFPVDVKVCNRWYSVNKESTEWLGNQLCAN